MKSGARATLGVPLIPSSIQVQVFHRCRLRGPRVIMTGSAEHEATLMGLCNDFVAVHRRLAQLESLLPEEELPPPPPAKRQCTTQVAAPQAGPPPANTEGCGSQPPSAMPSAQGCRCSKGHLLKRAVVGTWRGGLVCDGPCGRSLRSNMARWSCAACDFDLCAARHPSCRTRAPSRCAPPQS